tara:strand:- start:127 stop:2508 length:2382 start_codon:yes stop_codon:yes gene_type:complete
MSRFKRTKIKSSKKSSVSINEKIAALNKELQKTGMISEMDTSNVYQTTSLEPNQTHSSFNAASFNGLGLGHSGSDGEGSGGAYTGKVIAGEHGLQSPAHDYILNLDGVAISPPHPVSGKRVYASTRTGMVSFSPTQPGKIQGNSEYPTGSVMWIWNPSANNSDGTTGQWFPLEFHPVHKQYGFWDTGFLGFAFLNINLDQLEFTSGDNTGATLLALVNSLGIFNTNNIGAPQSTVLKQDPLGDPSFLPIEIMRTIAGAALGAAKEAFEFFKSKAKSPPKPEKKYEKNRKKNRPKPRSKPKPDSDSTEPDTEKDYEKNRRKNRPEVTGEVGKDFANEVKKVAGEKLKELGNFWNSAVETSKTVKSTIEAIPTSGNTLVGWAKNNNPDHEDYRKNDPTSDNYEGPLEVKTSTKWKNDVGKQLKKSLPDKSDYEFDGQEGPTWEERLKNSKDGKVTLNDYEIKKLSDKMVPGANGDMRFHTLFNSLPPEVTEVTINSEGEIDIESNYRFTDRDDVSSGGPLMKDWVTSIAERDKTGKTYDFLDKKGGDKVLGQVHDINIKLKLNMNGGNKSNWPRKELQKESYITEGVGLGHFEPEELNVDIEDLRKGVMPEYPKKAPPEMIDGYSVASKLAPRVVKGEPTIKITKKDLAKFHKLKKSEIDEFMNDVNQINDYLQKNPADLIYAQQRYPKDDPRLAALNWQMDQMLDAGKEYLDSNFKENQALFKRATERTKKNTALTNPDYIQKHYDELRGTIKPEPKPTINRKSPSRFFKKPKKKSSMEAINDKIKQLDKDLLI